MSRSEIKRQNGRFARGVSGNLSGRPLGRRNKATLLLEQLLEDDGERIIKKLLELAHDGNMQALKLVLDRIAPVPKGQPVDLELKPIETADDLGAAFNRILEGISEGRITPDQGKALSEILTKQADALERVLRERRILSANGWTELFSGGGSQPDADTDDIRNDRAE